MNKNGYPITLNGDEVRAILAGRSMQVQRLIKPQPPKGRWDKLLTCRTIDYVGQDHLSFFWGVRPDGGRQPAYQPGDLLWVREVWRIGTWSDCVCCHECTCGIAGQVLYKANCGFEEVEGPWRSPVTMPRIYARLWLNVTDVRAEQLDGCPGDWVWVYEFERAVAKLRLGEMEGREE